MYSQFVKIIGSAIGVGIILLLGYFMFFRNKDVPGNSSVPEEFSQTKSIERRSAENKGILLAGNAGSPQKTGFQYLFQPITRPLEPAVSYITGVFSSGSGENNNSTGDSKSFGAESEFEHGFASQPALSEEQIFDILWPESYRDALVMLQDLMIKDNFITTSEKNTIFATDDQIYAVLFKIAEYAKKQGWVGPADATQLQKGIQELERLISMERANLRTTGKISSGLLLPGGQRIDKTPMAKQDFFSMIVDGLKYSLTTNSANAEIPGGGNWVTSPDCYKDLAPSNPVPGANLWVFCCNCGLYCVGYYCEFIDDCGPYSTQCNVPLGCLNLICGAWPNAIWDPETGICGCG